MLVIMARQISATTKSKIGHEGFYRRRSRTTDYRPTRPPRVAKSISLIFSANYNAAPRPLLRQIKRVLHQSVRGMKLSIIIANYNYRDFVGAAMESALAVDWPDKEVICRRRRLY